VPRRAESSRWPSGFGIRMLHSDQPDQVEIVVQHVDELAGAFPG
jgi:hypothetical protein